MENAQSKAQGKKEECAFIISLCGISGRARARERKKENATKRDEPTFEGAKEEKEEMMGLNTRYLTA